MEISEIKKLSKAELQKLLEEKRDKLYQIRFGLSQKKVKNVREVREVKKDIARILTLLNRSEKSELNSNAPK